MAPDLDKKRDQMSLNLITPHREIRDQSLARSTVANFVDANTLSVRRDALRRVQEAGIFEAPKKK